MNDTYMLVGEVAAHLRVSDMTIYRLIDAGTLPHVRVGRSYRIARADLDTFVERQRGTDVPIVIVVRHPDHSNMITTFGMVRTFDFDLGYADLTDDDERAEWVETHEGLVELLRVDGRHDAAAYAQGIIDEVVRTKGPGR